MDIREELQALSESAPARIAAASTMEELAAAESDITGKKSPVAAARRMLGKIDPDQRREVGILIKRVAVSLQRDIDARRSVLLLAEETADLAADAIDITLPGRGQTVGTHHIIQQVVDEIIDIFVALGFTVARGPEVETSFYNFTALNIPDTHPSRLETDTLYVDYGDDDEGVLLRTHTSPMQARYMEQNDPPVYVVVPGKVFRSDPLDPTHSPVFHQVEGLAVDTDITFGDLKGTLEMFAKQFLGKDTEVKFIPHYFPFTEPSAEMHAYSNGRWLELLGCGMVNPAVFENVGYDPSVVTGFAFGMGVERLAMVRHGVTDLRYLLEN
ncbi:MAG TPA: phenylalanine--tRNA ligase subunit alpha, partial [Actinobacteria bacterium]|nr:phenylalanine--tRNA ligase subunit alpha [Actinomycetota bacterium]